MTARDAAPGQAARTWGQVAYEGFVAFQGHGDVTFETWDEKDEHGDSAVMGRHDWEAAGQAVARAVTAAAAAQGAPEMFATEALVRFADDGQWLTCTEDGILDMRAELLAVKRAVREVFDAAAKPKPKAAPEPLTVTPGDGTPIGGLLGHVMGTGQEPAAAPEVAVQDTLARVLGWFKTRPQSAMQDASVTRSQLARAYHDGNIPMPNELRRFL